MVSKTIKNDSRETGHIFVQISFALIIDARCLTKAMSYKLHSLLIFIEEITT